MNGSSLVILGTFSVIQALILPGMIILKYIKFSGSWLQKLVYTAGLSLTSSYILVVLLVILKAYTQWVLIFIFLLETFFVIFLFRDRKNKSIREAISDPWRKLTQTLQSLLDAWSPPSGLPDLIKAVISLVAFTLSLTLLWWSLKLMLHYSGTVFDAWDAVVSWNRWATFWANGEFPLSTRNYPQLVPTNYSLAYVFMGGTEIQFFAKFIALPMAFFILLMPFDLALQTKKSGFFLGTIIIYLLLKKFLILELTNGYVDGIMAFFSLLTVYTLIKLGFADDEAEKKQLLFLGFIFSGAAAVVKQPGIYIFLFYPIWLYFGIFRQGEFPGWQRQKRLLLSSLAFSTLLALPWYIYKQIIILLGSDRTGVSELIEASANNNYNVGWFQQIIDTISGFEIYLILFPIILLAFFTLKPLYRWLVITLILPYPILWALIASYDTRNLSIFIPIFGLVAGLAFEKWIDWGLSLFDFGKLKLWMIALVIAIGLSVGLAAKFPNAALSEKQLALQSQLFSEKKNALLYDLVEREGTSITIITSYPLRFLSGFDEVELYDNYKNYAVFMGKLEANEVDYLLVPEDIYVEPQINAFINEQIEAGIYKLVWEEKSWKYYKLLRVIR